MFSVVSAFTALQYSSAHLELSISERLWSLGKLSLPATTIEIFSLLNNNQEQLGCSSRKYFSLSFDLSYQSELRLDQNST